MSVKSTLSRLYARFIAGKLHASAAEGVWRQQQVLKALVSRAAHTAFGRAHRLEEVSQHADFVQAVPVRDYEQLSPWIDRIKSGERDVLWPGLPLYFCKTSGTTSGTKFIPLTRASLPNHIGSARNALLMYIAETGHSDFVDGKMIFLQGSPKLERLPSGIPYGRLSGIVANHVPAYLQKNRMPALATNCIEDWETKVSAIADETLREDMRLISGIPSWVQMYFEVLLQKTGKSTIREIFPNFSLFVYGGVNYEPYRNRMVQLMGADIPSIELFPASEGFIAFQDSRQEEGLLLNTDSGIFFEFIPADRFFEPTPPRLALQEVKTGVNYVLLLSNNAGLWGYNLGDTVRFVSLDPPRIKVTGRIKHFTSAFGEHVIAEEVERAMTEVCRRTGTRVSEFHVAPQLHPTEGLPYHEWLIEFDGLPDDPEGFALLLDNKMTEQNVYYRDLIAGRVLRTLRITPVPRASFARYMKRAGKLGGQNKVPRLANDRNIADGLLNDR